MASKIITLEAILNEVSLLKKEVVDLRKELKDSKASTGNKAPKEVDPDAPKKEPNSWILFTVRVRQLLKDAGKDSKLAISYASFLAGKEGLYPKRYEMDSDTILGHWDEFPIPTKEEKEAKKEAKAKAKEEAEAKPKRTLSEEHKAKMAAGRKAAAERRKAEAAAKEAEAALKALEGLVEEEEAAVPSPKAKAPPKAPKTLKPTLFKGRKLLIDEESGACWENKEGVKGKWVGVLEGKGKDRVLKDDFPEPEED